MPMENSRAAEGVGVGVFSINGPKESSYLGTAAQDAVVGALNKKGRTAKALPQVLDPDRLNPNQAKKSGVEQVVAGRINVVGDTYRVLLKWTDGQGNAGQEYLEVSSLNQLVPQLENFARTQLPAPSLAAAPAPLPPPAEKAPPVEKPKKSEAASDLVQAPAPAPPVRPAPQVSAAPAPVPETKKAEKQEAKQERKIEQQNLQSSAQGFTSISQRLPYEVRGLAFGDVDGDGQKEVVLTSTDGLFVYRLQGDGQLSELGRYSGKKLDNFVKVGIFPGTQPLILLTNLRGDRAMSKVLTFSGGQVQVKAEDIPYQLRVAFQGERAFLLGEAYHASAYPKHEIYEMELSGSSLKPKSKVDLPYEVGLYSFDWIPASEGSGWDLVTLLPSGKLKFFRDKEGKYKKAWTSRDSYGGSANDVPVEVRDMFNEVVADYYIVPLGLDSFARGSRQELVLAKNDMLLKDIVGRKPLATDGKMVRLQWDQLGFSEVWESKKVDGSILDYLVTSADPDQQLLVAVRVRDQGFWEGIGRKDSVLLVYDLNATP